MKLPPEEERETFYNAGIKAIHPTFQKAGQKRDSRQKGYFFVYFGVFVFGCFCVFGVLRSGYLKNA
ncbi:MAG: hypothetical protein JNM22_11300 [Saprospiraceae bacterium]|nr:hypothetical protein [Saprospiraceae bacterium]